MGDAVPGGYWSLLERSWQAAAVHVTQTPLCDGGEAATGAYVDIQLGKQVVELCGWVTSERLSEW